MRRLRRKIIFRLFILSLAGFLAVFFRFKLIGLEAKSTAWTEWMNPVAASSDLMTRFFTKSYLAAHHFWLLIFPYNLSHNWQFESISLIETILDPRNIFTAFIFSIFFLWIKCCFHSTVKKIYKDNLRLSLLLTIIPFIPVSGVFFDVSFVLAERVLYIPSLGFCLLISTLFFYLHKEFKEKYTFLNKTPLIQVFFILIIFSHALRTIKRNKDWKNYYTLLESAYKTVPHNSGVQHRLGTRKMQRGQKKEGQKLLEKALRSKFYAEDRFYDFGVFLRQQGRDEEALLMFEKEIKISRLPIAYLEIAKIYTLKGQREKAKIYITQAKKFNGKNAKPENEKIDSFYNFLYKKNAHK